MLSDTVGERLATWRRRRGWNRERLAEECVRLGMPELTHAAITNIESGRRKDGKRRRTVSVDELTVLALALNIPPLILLTPYPDSRPLEAIPGTTIPSYFMFTWFAGDELLPEFNKTEGMNEYFNKRELFWDAAEPIRQVRLHAYMVLVRNKYGNDLTEKMEEIEEINRADDARSEVAKVDNSQARALAEASRDHLLGEIRRLDESIASIRDKMRENDWHPPVLPPAIQYLDEKSRHSRESHGSDETNASYLQAIISGEELQERVNIEEFGQSKSE